jgi:2-dehydropantoate 2-reductase
VQADTIKDKFDAVLLSCKAYDLDDAIKSFAPAVGPQTAVIPMLNGMLHLDTLDRQFGRERVLGGLCAIAVTLNEQREVVQLQPMQSLAFGERDGAKSARVTALAQDFASVNGALPSDNIIQGMWEKWVFLTSIAASTCLMRGPIGAIVAAPGGRDFLLGMIDECTAVAKAAGHEPSEAAFQRTRTTLTTEGSPLTASMFRDIKIGAKVEADHVVGDMIARADAAKIPVPRLRTAYTHLKAYEKVREQAG